MTTRALSAMTALSLLLVSPGITSAEEDTKGFVSSVNLGATLTEGNSETLNAALGLDTKRITGRNEIRAGADLHYGEAEEETVTQKATAEGQIRQMIGEESYWYAGADVLHDDIAGLDYRITIGPGLGIDLINSDATRLNAELGAVWVAEESGDDRADDFVAWRLAEVFEHALSETARIWQSAGIVPEAEDFDNFIVTAEIGAESAMTERISLRIVLQDRFDNTPAVENGVELEENDITLIGGISVKL